MHAAQPQPCLFEVAVCEMQSMQQCVPIAAYAASVAYRICKVLRHLLETRFWGAYWEQTLCCLLVSVSLMCYEAYGTADSSVCFPMWAVWMQMFGKVEVPKEAFVSAIAINTDA